MVPRHPFNEMTPNSGGDIIERDRWSKQKFCAPP
jgi:hypothetical protein